MTVQTLQEKKKEFWLLEIENIKHKKSSNENRRLHLYKQICHEDTSFKRQVDYYYDLCEPAPKHASNMNVDVRLLFAY